MSDKLSLEGLLLTIDKIMNYYFLNKQPIGRDEMIELNQAKKQIKSLLTPVPESVKSIQTINRFIKLLNGMPEDVQQDFYRRMAKKIKPVPKEKVDELVDKYDEILRHEHNVYQSKNFPEHHRFLLKQMLKAHDNLREGKEG